MKTQVEGSSFSETHSSFSETLHLSFRVEEQIISLVSVSPRGTGLAPDDGRITWDYVDCGRCGIKGPQPGQRICDACAVEEWIACVGTENWLESARVSVNQAGLLHVHGYIEWPRTVMTLGSTCQEDGKESFHTVYLQWDGSPLHCLIEPEEDGELRWEPGWYFYDEAWHGPFASYTEANKALKKYVEAL